MTMQPKKYTEQTLIGKSLETFIGITKILEL